MREITKSLPFPDWPSTTSPAFDRSLYLVSRIWGTFALLAAPDRRHLWQAKSVKELKTTVGGT